MKVTATLSIETRPASLSILESSVSLSAQEWCPAGLSIQQRFAALSVQEREVRLEVE